MAERGQQELSEGDAGEAPRKVRQDAVKVVLMPDGDYAVAVEVPPYHYEPGCRSR